VTIRVSDRAAAESAYATVLGALGLEQENHEMGPEWDDFTLAQATGEKPVTTGLHIGFRAPSRELVEVFWQAGIDAGLRDDGAPGPRPEYGDDYYGGFLLDPDGNSIEAVHRGGMPDDAVVDHIWMRVADLEASRAFYDLVGQHAGYEPQTREGRIQYAAGRGSFSAVEGTPTREAHLAFPAPDTATVDAFHAAMVEAGYRDNGAPGPRLEYSPGYYGAFVLDPDGNNIELVTRTEPSPAG
jgi:catechol 2,3-dioxygenase-like lactoylglutathione lyase family enzyme